MLLLALETSCDETSAAVLEFSEKNLSFEILSNIVSSQIKIHSPWGGVVPMLAAREHLKNIFPVIDQALNESQKKLSQVDLLAVTQGPGLIPSLILGVNAMKTMAYFLDLPLLGVQHIEGHICANLIDKKNTGQIISSAFPVLSLVVSGGHTQLILEKSPRHYQIVGQTLDDAAGEAFDKVAKMLDLGYPGGPIVYQKALLAEKNIFSEANLTMQNAMQKLSFPRPMLRSKNLDFSFSGLKTSVLYFYQKIKKQELSLKQLERWKTVICFQFQEAVIDVLTQKTLSAIKQYHPKRFFLAGGVAANQALRKNLQKKLALFPNISFSFPEPSFCGDNAAMVAVAGAYQFSQLNQKQKKLLRKNWKSLLPDTNLKL